MNIKDETLEYQLIKQEDKIVCMITGVRDISDKEINDTLNEMLSSYSQFDNKKRFTLISGIFDSLFSVFQKDMVELHSNRIFNCPYYKLDFIENFDNVEFADEILSNFIRKNISQSIMNNAFIFENAFFDKILDSKVCDNFFSNKLMKELFIMQMTHEIFSDRLRRINQKERVKFFNRLMIKFKDTDYLSDSTNQNKIFQITSVSNSLETIQILMDLYPNYYKDKKTDQIHDILKSYNDIFKKFTISDEYRDGVKNIFEKHVLKDIDVTNYINELNKIGKTYYIDYFHFIKPYLNIKNINIKLLEENLTSEDVMDVVLNDLKDIKQQQRIQKIKFSHMRK